MKIIGQSKQREVFAIREGDEFLLSPVAQASAGRRPIARFDSEAELLAAANARNCRVTWQTS